ncbi:MAG TPA: hypothetical protein VE954_38650 [Oligoflexus sp.]|uniref:hypothetical protein n=1 Tax=Oligoflexus sp. TaxID=1971216 RepID=UPI002D54A81E|nr:hypothetical protein [Oligoflexus sp.]HYX39062.1 hypothetical protein [Oligoflexus sp.]
MENADLNPHASVLSRSALHSYITGPASPTPLPKSAFNPYRKRSALLNIVSLEAAEEALQKSIEKEQVDPEVLSLPEPTRTLTGAAAAT